ncbi:MAG: ABC transporter permease [Pontiellaceae bacterium]
MMRTFICLLKREMRALFYTPLAYAVLFFFWLLSGLNFFWLLQQLADGERLIMAHQLLFNGPLLTFSLPVVVPLITMRLIAEERRLGTLEAVLTTPISETQFVIVKFVSAFIFYLILWLPALIYCGVLHSLCLTQGVVFLEIGILVASFTGVIFIGLFYNAVGLLMSAFTTNQVVAAIAGFTILFSSLLVFMLMGYSTQYEWIRSVGQFFSTFTHMLDFSRGVIDSRVVLLYLGNSIWMLYAAIRILEWKRN